jgi:hypothetical protein
VAGGTLGIATARFAVYRRAARNHDLTLALAPAEGGGMRLNFIMPVD